MEAARLATVDDLGDVAALLNEAYREVGDSKGGEMALRRELRPGPVTVDHIRPDVEDSDCLSLVGTIDDVNVGLALGRLETLRDGATICEITEIFVLEDARGVGVGEAMLDMAMDWARKRGCFRIESSVLPGNRAGKNFFERAAMVTRMLRVSTSLDD